MSTDSATPAFQPGYATCTSVNELCPIQYTIYGSYFNLGGNVFFAIVFGFALIAHLYLGIRHRTWAFTGWILVAAVMETMGYIARSAMHSNPWNLPLVSIQICGLLWGPTLITAGISIMFKDIVHYCGYQYSTVPPRWIPLIFIGTDVLTVLIQGIGGIIASVATSKQGGTLASIGENLIIAGVCFQVAHMAVCGTLMLIFMRRYKRGKTGDQLSVGKTEYQKNKERDAQAAVRFKWFTRMVSLAFVFIWIRSIYRVPEMAGGWANPIMRDETSFFVLDSVMITLGIWILVAFHPGSWFPGVGKQTTPNTEIGL